MVTLTEHSIQRGSERLNLNAASLQRLADKAFTEGVTHADTRGRLNRYLSRLFFVKRQANNLRIYGRHVFIFNDSTLVTVHLVPNELVKLLPR